MMSINKMMTAALLASLFSCTATWAAAGTAQTVSVKMGYFNLLQVKAAFPAAAAVNALEDRAKDFLRRDLDAANSTLTDMQKQNKTKEEIEKRAKDLQLEITAKQQAYGQLLSSNSLEASRAIAQAVAAVAKDKGLDLVVDASGIYAGGEKFSSSAEDVTEAVLKKLVPSTKPAESAH
jgi:Skp family chaperone for outer membrane proteins